MLINDNAYLILGLSTNADEKLINKRYKEQLKFLNINEIPKYEDDFSFIDYKSIRVEEKLNQAFLDLSSEKKKIYQIFFWLQIIDEDDKQLFSEIKNGNFDSAIMGWNLLYQETGKYYYLKNASITGLLLFENKNNIGSRNTYNDSTINSLQNCIQSEEFWNEFVKILNIYSDLHISNEVFQKFKLELPQYLADMLFNEDEQDKSLYVSYSSKSKKSAKNFDNNKEITALFNKIDRYKKAISEFNLKSDYTEIIDLVNNIETELNKLNDRGLQNNSSFIRQRNNIARDLRNLAIDFHNQLNYYQISIDILKKAQKTAFSKEIINKINEDIEVIKTNALYSGIFIDDKENNTKHESKEKKDGSYRISKPNIIENINGKKSSNKNSGGSYRISKPLEKESLSSEEYNKEREEIIEIINMIKNLIKNGKKDEALLLINATLGDSKLKDNEVVRLKTWKEKLNEEIISDKNKANVENVGSKREGGLEKRKHGALKDAFITAIIIGILIFILYLYTK